MLWYKSWLETRWRFLIGLALLVCSAAAIVITYPKVVKLLPLVPSLEVSGEIGRRIRESAELSREYRGYVWSQWFRQNLSQTWTLFAALLGTGGLFAQTSGGGALFTLSLPVSRTRLMTVRAATGLVELLVLALIPSLMIPLLSPAVGETYSVSNALVHSVCLFIAGTVFFSLACLLSTVFGDVWRPLLIVVCASMMLALVEQVFRDVSPFGVFRVMSAEVYFRGGGLPWLGLAATAAVSAAMLYAATKNIARQDF
jgi:ABC-type transport system involved in multi-copper enzyme maturation permease subunit